MGSLEPKLLPVPVLPDPAAGCFLRRGPWCTSRTAPRHEVERFGPESSARQGGTGDDNVCMQCDVVVWYGMDHGHGFGYGICLFLLVGGLVATFYFPRNIGLLSSSQLTNSYFSEG